jgi:uncharacterized protein YecE (DUF72 family)
MLRVFYMEVAVLPLLPGTSMQSHRNRNLPLVRVGVSGWRYAGWRGKFYPGGLPQKRELTYAAACFNTIELNGSFYSLQRPVNYSRWYTEVPDDFVFAVKGPRFVTHMLRLRGARTALANFFASGLFELEEKLGPILWQLPPSFQYDRQRLENFFGLLPRSGADASRLARKHDDRIKARARLRTDPKRKFRYALEVRHESFVQPDFINLLRRHRIALVVADTAGKWPLLEDVTADFVYVRLHGDKKIYESGYSDAALDLWAAKIDAWRRGGQSSDAKTASPKAPPRRKRRDVYVYFDNDMKVHAPADAANLAGKLAAVTTG